MYICTGIPSYSQRTRYTIIFSAPVYHHIHCAVNMMVYRCRYTFICSRSSLPSSFPTAIRHSFSRTSALIASKSPAVAGSTTVIARMVCLFALVCSFAFRGVLKRTRFVVHDSSLENPRVRCFAYAGADLHRFGGAVGVLFWRQNSGDSGNGGHCASTSAARTRQHNSIHSLHATCSRLATHDASCARPAARAQPRQR